MERIEATYTLGLMDAACGQQPEAERRNARIAVEIDGVVHEAHEDERLHSQLVIRLMNEGVRVLDYTAGWMVDDNGQRYGFRGAS